MCGSMVVGAGESTNHTDPEVCVCGSGGRSRVRASGGESVWCSLVNALTLSYLFPLPCLLSHLLFTLAPLTLAPLTLAPLTLTPSSAPGPGKCPPHTHTPPLPSSPVLLHASLSPSPLHLPSPPLPSPSPLHLPSPSPLHLPSPSPLHLPSPSPLHLPSPPPLHLPSPSPLHLPSPSPLHLLQVLQGVREEVALTCLNTPSPLHFICSRFFRGCARRWP